MFDFNEVLPDLGKLVLAAFLGGAIGFEREAHGQAAGIRTNILVGVGACLMMMLSLNMESLYRHLTADSTVRLDPGRIASYAIASMGFLGGGAIIKGRGSVRGLTTAAGLWLVTGIGLSIGAGYIIPAVASSVLSLLILYNIRRAKILFTRDMYSILILKFAGAECPLDRIKTIFAEFPEVTIQRINFYQTFSPPTITYRLRLMSKEIAYWREMVKRLSDIPDLAEVSWEEGNVP
jgi:putative Mg2+ transporter-C (MgtC) family protein